MGEIERDARRDRVKTVFYEVENKPKFYLVNSRAKKKKVKIKRYNYQVNATDQLLEKFTFFPLLPEIFLRHLRRAALHALLYV